MSALVTLAEGLAGAAVPAGIAAWAAVRAARVTASGETRAADAQAAADRGTVEALAFSRAREIYESALKMLEEQVRQMQEQLDRMNRQLSDERDTSLKLLGQIRTLEDQLRIHTQTISDLRRQLATSVIEAVQQVHGTD